MLSQRAHEAGAAPQLPVLAKAALSSGAATLADSNSTYGLYVSNGATFDNESGASFAFTTDGSINNYGGTPAGGTWSSPRRHFPAT